jgi:hypothetical protein
MDSVTEHFSSHRANRTNGLGKPCRIVLPDQKSRVAFENNGSGFKSLIHPISHSGLAMITIKQGNRWGCSVSHSSRARICAESIQIRIPDRIWPTLILQSQPNCVGTSALNLTFEWFNIDLAIQYCQVPMVSSLRNRFHLRELERLD